MELEAIIGRLCIQDGKRVEGDVPGVRVEMPPDRPARGRNRDMLFVHLILSSRETPTATLYRAVVDALASAYFLAGGSVTAALRQAIRAANEYLMRHNVRVQGVDKQQGGVTCAVLRDEEVFISQAGPALAFVAHQGRLERLPVRPPGHVTPLGVGYGVDTRFHHSWVRPGDVVLLADPEFGTHTDEQIGPALTYRGVAAGIESLAGLCTAASDAHARLMLIEFAPREPSKFKRRARSESEPAPAPAPPVAASIPEHPLPSATSVPQRPSIEIDVEESARKVASGVASGMARLTGGLGRLLERLFEGDAAGGQAVKKDRGPSPAALGLLAVAIPVLVAVVVLTVFLQRGRSEQFQETLFQMEQESQLAQAAAGDELAARAHWQRVLALSDEAMAFRPSHETVLQFREQANQAMDVLDEITRLIVHPLYRYAGDAAPVALTVQSLAVYVLDFGLDRVYKHLLESELQPVGEGEPEILMFKDQAVGANAIGDLVDVTWLKKTGGIREEAVAALDASGLLLIYRPSWGDVRSSRLVLPPAWDTPAAISVYGDKLYVLDTGARQIWRFDAIDGGFPDGPSAYQFLANQDDDPANDIDLSQMLDITIDRDGNLYLLGSDGAVTKFFGGERKQFSLDDLREPLVAPTAIYCSVTGLNPFFYIADAGSGRIVQTTQQGLFWAQYRAKGADTVDPFAQITDIYVQEAPLLRLYATGGNEVFVASLQ